MLHNVRDTKPPLRRFDPATGWPLRNAPQKTDIIETPTGLQLGIAGAKPIADTEPAGSIGGRRLPKGLAISSQGRIFLCDPAARVVLTGQAHLSGEVPHPRLSPLWPARDLPIQDPDCALADLKTPTDPYTLVEPVDVAIAPNGDLAIVDAGARRLLVIAFPTAFIRQAISFDDATPTAIAFDRFGHAHVLLTNGVSTIARFNPNWQRDPTFPHHSLALSNPQFIGAVIDATCGCGASCGCTKPKTDTALVVVSDSNGIHQIGRNGRVLTGIAPDRLSPPPLRLDADRTLLWDDPAFPNHAPLRLTALKFTADGRMTGTKLALIALPRRIEIPRYGTLITAPLDGGKTGFAWDRLALNLALPENTRLVVSTLTSDSALEPDRVLREPATRWSTPLTVSPKETPEVLIQSQSGRYLWIRIAFFGDGEVTPTIASADVFGPRRSSLHDLPAVFQQDPESAHFLDRFLSYFDTGLNEIAQIGNTIPELLDPYATDPEFIDWLGSWFDLEFQADWTETTRREMIAQAIPYFKKRGTIAGIKQMLQWHTGLSGDMPQIVEHYRLAAFASPPAVAGVTLDITNTAHRFTIIVPACVVSGPDALTRLRRVIDANAPAHTRFDIITVEPGITIGLQSTISVDTVLGDQVHLPLGHATLGATFSTQGPLISGPLPFHTNPIKGQSSCQ